MAPIKIHTDDSLIKQDIQVTTNEGDSFRANFANVFEKYIRLPITTEKDMNLWRSNPIQFWQNQLNFAV